MSAPPTYQLTGLLEKMTNNDPDYRFMSLNDLLDTLRTSPGFHFSQLDSSLSTKLLDGVIKLLDDQNGEVQNLAVKCLGGMVSRIKDGQIGPLVEKLAILSTTAQDPSIPSTALRTVITNLPRPTLPASKVAATGSALQSSSQSQETLPPITVRPEIAQASVNAATVAVQTKLLPRLRVQLQPNVNVSLDTIDLLIESVRCFGITLDTNEVKNLQEHVMAVLKGDKSSGVVKKRGVIALSLLCVYAPDDVLAGFINTLIEDFRPLSTHPIPSKQRLLISICGALARGIPERFGPYLVTLAPFVLSVVDGKDIEGLTPGDDTNPEIDEVKETALIALEGFQANCPEEMKRFTEDLINAASVYIKYDPNYADAEDSEDEAMGGTQEDDDEEPGSDDDDDFEDDNDEFSDEDDMSWKVRRCAAKLLATVISTRGSDLIGGVGENGGKAYTAIAPLLVGRFHEREENVRLEILSTMTGLVNKTGEVAEQKSNIGAPRARSLTLKSESSFGSMGPPPKKTRRGSDASMLDTFAVPETVFTADEQGVKTALTALLPKISRSLGKLLNNKSTTIPTKFASITLLSAIVTVLHGGLEKSLSTFVAPLVTMASGQSLGSGGTIAAAAQGGSAATATSSGVRIEAFRLLSKIFENHSAEDIAQYLDGLVVPALISAVDENGYKVSFEALGTVISLCRLLTAQGTEAHAQHLQKLYDVVVGKCSAANTDLEVREKSLLTLGIILSRTAGTEAWIDTQRRHTGLEVLLDRLNNETTRITAARAIEGIVKNVTVASDVTAPWTEAVATECGAQLGKSNRALLAASLDALRFLTTNSICRNNLSAACKKDLMGTVTPLLENVGDMLLLGSTIAIMSSLMLDGQVSADERIVTGICNLMKTQIGSGVVLENLLEFIKVVGERDPAGRKELMKHLLSLGVNPQDTRLVAQVTGELFVSGGGNQGGFAVTIKDGDQTHISNITIDSFVQEAEGAGEEKKVSLALLILGQIGLRQGKAFTVPPQSFLKFFQHPSDQVPIAAAISLGLVGAGNVQAILPVIMQRLQAGHDSYLLVHSLKEIIQHSAADPDSIKSHADAMWNTLLSAATINDDSKAAAAECVGRLTVMDAWQFLPQLRQALASPSPAVRGLVISALRYTFTETDASYDDALRSMIVDFLDTMLQDTELDNRRLALTALNSAASNKAHLIQPGLNRLLPKVYTESIIRPELVREVQMGPFKHKIDDGLELRKSAYETLYALLDTAFDSLDINTYFERTIAGLVDDQDIRSLSCLMMSKLVALKRDEAMKRLEPIADAIRKVLGEKLKDSAVKQELERFKEGVKGVVKVAVLLQREGAGEEKGQAGQKWKGLIDYLWASWKGEVLAVTGEQGL